MAVVDTWTDAGKVAAAVTALIGCGYAIRRAVASIRAWVVSMVARTKEAFSAAVDDSATGHLVKYHLGPNGKTTPMHVRMARLEVVHDIEDQERP